MINTIIQYVFIGGLVITIFMSMFGAPISNGFNYLKAVRYFKNHPAKYKEFRKFGKKYEFTSDRNQEGNWVLTLKYNKEVRIQREIDGFGK